MAGTGKRRLDLGPGTSLLHGRHDHAHDLHGLPTVAHREPIRGDREKRLERLHVAPGRRVGQAQGLAYLGQGHGLHELRYAPFLTNRLVSQALALAVKQHRKLTPNQRPILTPSN